MKCYHFSDKGKALFVQRLTSVERKLSESCFVADSLPVPAFYFQVSKPIWSLLYFCKRVALFPKNLAASTISTNWNKQGALDSAFESVRCYWKVNIDVAIASC